LTGLGRSKKEIKCVAKRRNQVPNTLTEFDLFFINGDLEHLLPIFKQNGFDELELVYEVEQNHLTTMEVSLKDQAILKRLIKANVPEKEKFQTVIQRISRSRGSRRNSDDSISIAIDKKDTARTENSLSEIPTKMRPTSRDSQISTTALQSIESCKQKIEVAAQASCSSDLRNQGLTRRACWTCLKQYYTDEEKSQTKRMYCSEQCERLTKNVDFIKCGNCCIYICKTKALRFDDNYYCSKSCQPNLKDIAANIKEYVIKNKLEKTDPELVLKLYQLSLHDAATHAIPEEGEDENNQTQMSEKRSTSIRPSSGILKPGSRPETGESINSNKRVSFNNGTVFETALKQKPKKKEIVANRILLEPGIIPPVSQLPKKHVSVKPSGKEPLQRLNLIKAKKRQSSKSDIRVELLQVKGVNAPDNVIQSDTQPDPEDPEVVSFYSSKYSSKYSEKQPKQEPTKIPRFGKHEDEDEENTEIQNFMIEPWDVPKGAVMDSDIF